MRRSRSVLVDGGRAVGVQLADGRCIAARDRRLQPQSVAAVPAPGRAQPICRPSSARRIARYRNGSGTFRMNVALSELPDFTCLPGKAVAEHHQ